MPVAERARYMLAFLDALLAMNDDVTWSSPGRWAGPVRYGGEKGGLEERVRAMVAIAEEALKPYYPAGEGRLPPLHRARAARRGDGHRAVELSLSHRRSTPSCPA